MTYINSCIILSIVALHSDYVVPDPFDFTFVVTDTTVCNNVTIIDDSLGETNETLILTIPSSSSHELGPITTLTIIIVDNGKLLIINECAFQLHMNSGSC